MAGVSMDSSDVLSSVSSNSTDLLIQEDKGTEDSQFFPAPSITKDLTASIPDATPSRRSSRKKQSTFSSDFEYYTPTGRRVEIDVEPTAASKGKQTGKSQKAPQQKIAGSEDENEEDDSSDDDDDDDEIKKFVQKKVNERKQKGKEADEEDDEVDKEESSKSGKWKVKVAVKRKAGKEASVKKSALKKQTDEESSSDEKDEEFSPDPSKVQKRKKTEAQQVKGKKMKVDESSDEEESTPISQLKAQLRQKKLDENKSPPRQNIMEKLAEGSPGQGSESDRLHSPALKRKMSAGDGSVDEGPTKAVKTIKVEKLGPALANLVKQLPPLMNFGAVKQSPSKVVTNSELPQRVASLAKVEENLDRKASVKTESDSSHGDKSKIHADIASRKLSSECDKTSKSLKTEVEKTITNVESHHKNEEKLKHSGKNVKFDPKIKGEVRHVKKVQIVRKPDGTIIKRKIIVPEGKTARPEEKHSKIKMSELKNGEKQLSGIQKPKPTVDGQKLKIPTGNSLNKKFHGQPAGTVVQKKEVVHAKIEGTGQKQQAVRSTSSEAIKKPDLPRQTVDDLLKRGIVHKKKSHQPFGNKNVVKIHGKDPKSEAVKVMSTKQEQPNNKPKVHKSEGSVEMKKSKDAEKRKLSDVHKHSNGKRRSSESNKGERRKSAEGVSKKSEKPAESGKKAVDDGPPALIPATGVGKMKHKHHKSEHEVPIDMTMMDLFKPDNLVTHDQQKKDEVTQEETAPGPSDKVSQYSEDAYSIYSFVKPENLHHILLEHQYSKPSSPVSPKQEGQGHTDAGTRRDDDIESVSHKQAVIMDVNLPEQILEESEEPVMEESVGDYQETWPDTMEELQLLVSRRDAGDRPSILESLDTELKEGGTEFRIVGQVEIERMPIISREESISTTQLANSTRQVETLVKNVSEVIKPSIESKKLSTDTKKPSTEKRRDSGDKKGHSSDRRDSTAAGNNDPEKRKHKKKKKLDAADLTQENDGSEDGGDEEEHRFEDDEKDLDWEPNDADTLYCICRKPHNNRFMICCDRCEEWYHGTCVGITKAKGKEMEEKEEEYICPLCAKGEKISVTEKQALPLKTAEVPLVLPKAPQKCVGRKCTRAPRPGSVYCSNECIMSHAQESLKAIRDEHMRKKVAEKQQSTKDKSSSSLSTTKASSVDTVEVVEKLTGKLLTGLDAPTQKGLHRWLEQNPTFEVVQPHKHRGRSLSTKDRDGKSDKEKKHSSEKPASSEKERKPDQADGGKARHDSTSSRDSEKKSDSERQRSSSSHKPDNSSSSSKMEERKEDGPNQIRLSVRTALRDSLTARAQEASDIMLSSNEIKNLAVTIEEELFSLFSDTGHKYRTKYRSLVFNIKDQKNKGLFRKILTGKIKPHKLVQMSTEELASRELAKWREQASKHELEMIEKSEKEAMKEREMAKHVRKKTHKGEVEVEDEDLSTLEIRLKEAKDVEPEPQEEQTQVPVVDTTDQHRAHLFDLNCKVCTGKMVPGSEEQAAAAASVKAAAAPLEPQKELTEAGTSEDREDYEKAEEIVKEAFRTMQKMEESVTSMPKIVSSSPREEEVAPPLSPKLSISRRESSSSTSSSTVSSASKKQVVVRSPDSALQSGLEAKPKFTPTGPVLWKGFMSMLDVAKFFTSAYQVSGPTDYITLPDTVHILGRISPDHMWDYLSKIRQAGSKDLTVIRFIPGSDDEKIAYIHLYSYLNSRGRCGVAGNPNKQVKDFYIVPLASHSRIPRTLLPFDGPGLEENRPHMLIGILVRQRGKHGADTSDTSSTGSGKSSSVSSSGSGKSGNLSSTGSGKSSSLSSTGSGKSNSLSSTSSATKHVTPPVNRDPRLAKLSAKEASPRVSPADSSSSSSSNAGEARPKPVEEYEPQYIKNTYKPVAEYIPTPTVKKKHPERAGVLKDGKTSSSDDSSGKSSRNDREKHRHHHQKKVEKKEEMEDSDPYSPGKEAEPYSPGQEAAADEPYDPADDSLIDDTGIPIVSSTTVSVNKSAPLPASAEPAADAGSSTKPAASHVESTAFVQKEKRGTKKKKTDSHTSDLVEKMARSNDPQEISSLMVIALSGVSSSQEQQRLLVELTKKVEERKLQLAEAARQGLSGSSIRADDSEKPRLDSQILSLVGNSEVAGDTVPTGCTPYVSTSGQSAAGSAPVGAPALSDASLNSAGLKTTTDQGPPLVTPSPSPALYTLNLAATSFQPLSAPGAVSQSDMQSMLSSDLQSVPSVSASASSAPQVKGTVDTVGIKFSINSSATKNRQTLSSSAAEIFTSETGEPKPKLPLPTEDTLTQLTFVPTRSDSTDVSRSVGTPDSSGDIPDALKALMDDVMGNTRFSSLEKRRKILLQKEVKRGEGTTKEFAKEEPDTKDKLVLEQQAEVQSKLIDEAEAKKILDNLKRLEKSGAGDDECRDSTKVDSASDDSKSDFSDTKKPSSSAAAAAPSIDELLDRLKRGGFQFNLQKAEISTPSSSSSSPSPLAPTASQPSVTPTNDSQSSGVSVHSLYSATSTPHPASVLPSQSSVSSAAAAAALDVDLRQKNDSQFPTPGGAISSGFEGDYPKATSYKDYVPGPLPVLHDQDDRTFYKDQDDRPYRAIPPHPPKHPLDPHAFPPLPGEVRCFPPPPSTTTVPLAHGPLHPRFPLPPTLDPHVPYHPTPRATLPSRSRTQPPPPGTESDRSAGVTGVTDDFPSDMDFRNKIRPPAPPHQPLPPLPTQSPPLLPPPPGFRGPLGGHYRQSSEDIDYRPPPSHRSDYYGRGRDRSFQ